MQLQLSIYLSICISVYLCVFLFIYLSIYLSVYLSIYLHLKTKLFCETSSVFELDNIKNETILRDFLNFRSWQEQKRSNSARLPHFSTVTTSRNNSARLPSNMFLLLFSSLTLPTCSFHLSILSEVWLLNLLRWPIYPNLPAQLQTCGLQKSD